MKRIKIPKAIKEYVKNRDKNTCVCCLEKRNLVFHHISPVSLGGNQKDHKNIVLLCKNHHNLLHLGELNTINCVAEYLFFLNNKKLAENNHDLEDLIHKYFHEIYK